MTTRSDQYDEAEAVRQFINEGCPNYSDSNADGKDQDSAARQPAAASRSAGSGRTRTWPKIVQQLRARIHELEHEARTDPLTGLPNRRGIETASASIFASRLRYHSGPLTLALIDLDHLKEINTRFLQPGGDQTLVQVGRAIVAALRQTDYLARIGGDEFAILAPETDADGATALAERIRGEVCETVINYEGQVIRPTVSMGFAVAGKDVAADYRQLERLIGSETFATRWGEREFACRLLKAK